LNRLFEDSILITIKVIDSILTLLSLK